MEQVKTFYRRYRWLFLAAAYLVVFAVGVLYLRVTISIPPEGDDKLTLNRWMYDFQRMPFWQYLLPRTCRGGCVFHLQEVPVLSVPLPQRGSCLRQFELITGSTSLPWTGAAAFSSQPSWPRGSAAGMPWRWAAFAGHAAALSWNERVCTATTPCPSEESLCSGPWRPDSALFGWENSPPAAARLRGSATLFRRLRIAHL